MFPFLWTLDLLSQRFNFWSLLRTRFFSRGSPASPSVSVPPTSSGVLPNVFNARTRDNASFSLRDKAMHNATAIRSRAPVSGICLCPSIESRLSFYLSCLALFFPFSFFFSLLYFSVFVSFSHSEPMKHAAQWDRPGREGESQIRTILLSFSDFAAGASDFTSLCRDKRLPEKAGR